MIFVRICSAVNSQHNADTWLIDTEIRIADTEIRKADTLSQRSCSEPLLSEICLNDTLSEDSFSELSSCLADSDAGGSDCTTCLSVGTRAEDYCVSSLFPSTVIPEPADALKRCDYHVLIEEPLQMAIDEPLWEGFRVEEGRLGLVLLARGDMLKSVFNESDALPLNTSIRRSQIMQRLDEQRRQLSSLAQAKRHLMDYPQKFSL